MYSFFANQSSGPQLDHEDLEQLDEFDLEEMDLKWQVAMISIRLKKFYKKTGRRLQFDAKEPVGFDKTKVECFNCHNTWHFARECRSKGNQESRRRDAGNTGYRAKDNRRRPGKQEEPKALVTLDGEGVDWTGHAEDEQENFALMAYSNSGSDTEVTSCSKECVESYAKLKKLYDEQREQLGDASIEIQAYTQALKKVEAQLVTHQKNQLWYEEKIRFMKIDLDDKTDVLTYHKKLLAEAVKEKEELKTKLENFQSSSKGLSKLLNSQMSTRDKSGLGYGDQVHNGVLSYENEVFQSVFDSRSSDVEDSPVHDRFANVEGMHAVPPPMTGNYMPSGPDREVDDSMFTYGPKQSNTSESDTQTSNYDSCESNSSAETLESVPEPVVVEPKVVSQPKVWSDAPIIKEYESDSDDEYVIQPSKEQENLVLLLLILQEVSTSTARKVNTARPIVNEIRPRNNFYKSHSPIRRLFNRTATPKARFSNQKVNTAEDNPQRALKNKGIVDSECSRHMTRNKAYLAEYQDYNGGPMCDKKNKVLFTDTECLVLSSDFKLLDENQVLLRISRQNNMYNFNLENIVPSGGLACLIAKATVDESNKWHRRFSWVFFLRTKDETSRILKDFIRQIENQLNQKVKTIRCDNGTKFKNRDIIEFCGSKGIKREYSNARTPQQNGVAERKNRTLIEAARTMLADSFLPNTFWAEVVSTACYVLNRVLVTKPQNKTPYELISGKIPIISYIRPFRCHVTILNTIDYLGQFKRKSNEGFLVGYSLNSKAFRVYNLETKRVEENLHIKFLENKPNVARKGPNWLFDLDYLTDSMNYQPVRSENQDNKHAGPKEANHSAVKSSEAKNEGEKSTKNTELKTNEKSVDQEDQAFLDKLERLKRQEKEANNAAEALRKKFTQNTEDLILQARAARASSTNTVNIASTPVSTTSPSGGLSFTHLTNTDQDGLEIPDIEDTYDNPNDGIFTNASYDDEGVVADFTNLETIVNVSPIPTSRINSIHPSTQILGDPKSAVQTRSKVNKSSGAHAFVSYIQKQRRNNHKDFQHCLFACFLSQIEPKKISEALEDESWVDAMQEELLQFKIQKVWILVDLPHGKKAIGTKWVYRNKKDERGVVVRNKARLVAQGHRQEEGIDYDEVFALVARIEAIRIFLAFASYMGFIVYQMDVKSAFLYGTIDEEIYLAWYATLSTFFLKSGYRRGTIDKTLFIKKDKNDIILVQVYVDDIIFGSTKRSWCDEFEALMKSRFQMSSIGELTFFLGLQVKQKEDETQKPLVNNEEATDVDVHLYRSMIGSLMYLSASRPDIMFAVCACSRFQVTPKTSHLNAVKRFFRRLISWQCKKQTIVATSTTEAEYVAVANYRGQVLWIQNQMLDYGFNFMNTKIYIDNESTICIVKNPVFHSKTNVYEKKLIQVLKIHTDNNVADLLTKAFDVRSYLGFRGSLERDIDGTEELLLPDLFILWLTKVCTDSAKLVPLGKDSTAIKPLEKIPPRV
ncbi:ribonuclease H-like domain-containing protein [Tanacetum coccineum]